MGRDTVLASRLKPALLLVAFTGLGWLLAVRSPGVSWRWLWLVFFALAAVFFVAFLVFPPRLTIDVEGVEERHFWRRWTTAWSAVEKVELSGSRISLRMKPGSGRRPALDLSTRVASWALEPKALANLLRRHHEASISERNARAATDRPDA